MAGESSLAGAVARIVALLLALFDCIDMTIGLSNERDSCEFVIYGAAMVISFTGFDKIF